MAFVPFLFLFYELKQLTYYSKSISVSNDWPLILSKYIRLYLLFLTVKTSLSIISCYFSSDQAASFYPLQTSMGKWEISLSFGKDEISYSHQILLLFQPLISSFILSPLPMQPSMPTDRYRIIRLTWKWIWEDHRHNDGHSLSPNYLICWSKTIFLLSFPISNRFLLN